MKPYENGNYTIDEQHGPGTEEITRLTARAEALEAALRASQDALKLAYEAPTDDQALMERLEVTMEINRNTLEAN